MNCTRLVEVLFSSYRRQILSLLLLRPQERYYIREIARLTGILPGSVHRELKLLAETGLLLREEAGNQVCYYANQSCPIFSELAEFSGKASVLLTSCVKHCCHLATMLNWPSFLGQSRKERSEATAISIFLSWVRWILLLS